MELIAELTDFDVFGAAATSENKFTRKAARAVLLDENDLVPILYLTKKNFHKLPGGGVEKGETIEQALARECMEEIGCEIEVTGEIGIIEEIRAEKEIDQTSFCYLGRITKKVCEPKFDKYELLDGYVLKWMTLGEAYETIKADDPTNYSGRFIQAREILFLEKAKELLK